jgi:hypothetical protein
MEELRPIEREIRALGIAVEGRSLFANVTELTVQDGLRRRPMGLRRA